MILLEIDNGELLIPTDKTSYVILVSESLELCVEIHYNR